MKHFIIFLFFSSLISYGQNTNKQASKQTMSLKKEIIKIIKKNSLYTDSLNWKQIKEENNTLQLSDNDSISQAMLFDFFTLKLREAGDKHSFFISGKSIAKRSEQPIDMKPEGRYAGDGIGIIKVPHCLNFDVTKDIEFANTIRAEIEKTDKENNISGWIVDLRHNTGGNMWPMLAGLNALTDDGTTGYFVSPDLKRKTPWITQNGVLNTFREKAIINDYKIKNKQVKIAVLIDSLTASSGEMTTISFIGLPNVKTFGYISAGYTTANNTINLSNGSQLYLASSFVSDRTGKLYPDNIVPDVLINNNSGQSDDDVMDRAKKWLLK